ncbi:MAG: permease [Clostridiaceae bacterium]|nr:permease [Clostridiaceae bacterium]
MSYRNFKIAIYCPVGNLNSINDLNKFEQSFKFFEKHLNVDKVYLETYRGNETIDWDKMRKIKEFFNSKGIQTSGGITTTVSERGEFVSLCYNDDIHKNGLKEIITKTAELFDEIILDDFFFTNCRCKACIEAKCGLSWAEYRTELMKEVSIDYVIRPAKEVNPNVNLIIKYPNWYEHYQETGYNLKDEPSLFDMIYTGTETRDSMYTQQHLPRYLSYFIMRYMENVKPGKNGGGWFDPYQCSYNLQSYADQARLTVFGKAKEVTLFCLGALLDRDYSMFVPIGGYVLETMDEFVGGLGNPIGTACYIPYHSMGEDYLHNYMGMLGIPLEPYPYFESEEKNIFLTENAAYDKEIVSKIETALLEGRNVIITSGLLKALQNEGVKLPVNVRYTDRKAYINEFALSAHGISFEKIVSSTKSILIPQLEYATNDVWQLISGLGNNNNFPILLNTKYSNGNLSIVTIPDDFGDLYHYPREVLNSLRKAFSPNAKVSIDTVGNVGLFTYDNNTFVVKSFLPHQQDISIYVDEQNVKLVDMVTGESVNGICANDRTVFNINLSPMLYRAYKIDSV